MTKSLKMESDGLDGFMKDISLNLKEITDKMVFEGVTPKLGMRRVKAMKRLWRSDSFQVLKAILVEPPIQEGSPGPKYMQMKDEEDDQQLDETEGLPIETAAEKEQKERNNEYARRKEELTAFYQELLCQDLAMLKERTDEMVEILVNQTKKEMEHSETELLENEMKSEIQKSMSEIKCFKKRMNGVLKMTWEDERKLVKKDLLDFLDKEMEIRIATYKKMLDKMLSYNIRQQAEIIEDEFENKIRQRVRTASNRFQLAKNALIEKQKKKLKVLECKLEEEFRDHEKLSESRVKDMLDLAINNLDEDTQSEEGGIQSQCSVAEEMRRKMVEEGILPKEVKYESLTYLVQELLKRYQQLIEMVRGNQSAGQNEYLLSIERLEDFQKDISESLRKKLIENDAKRTRRKNREEARLRTISIIEYLIRQAIQSPPPSRTSLPVLDTHKAEPCKHIQKPVFCHNLEVNADGEINWGDTSKVVHKSIIEIVNSDVKRFTNLLLDKPIKLIRRHSGNLVKPIDMVSKDIKMDKEKRFVQENKIRFEGKHPEELKDGKKDVQERSSSNIFTEEAKKSFVSTVHRNPKLYSIFFSSL